MSLGSVVIHFDNARRDLLASRLLQEALRDRGVEAHIANQRTDTISLRQYKPAAFVSSRGDFPWLRRVAECSSVYVLPSEGARLTNETMTAVFTGRSGEAARAGVGGLAEDTFAFIRRVFLWGPQTRDVLLESGLFTPEQLLVAGNVRFDLYDAMLRRGRRRPGAPFTVGVAFSVKTTSTFDGRPYYARWLYGLEENVIDRLNLLPPGRHWEDLVWRDFAVLRRLMQVVRRIIERTDWHILLRVGVFEDPTDYEFVRALAPDRVRIQDPRGQHSDFFRDIDVMLTCSSTIGMEALALEVPVVAMLFAIPDERLSDHINPDTNGLDVLRDIYYSPSSADAAMALLTQASKGELALTPEPEVAADTLHRLYNWPMPRPAADVIADSLVADMTAGDGPAPTAACFREHARFADRRLEGLTRAAPWAEGAIFPIARALSVPKFYLTDLRTGAFRAHREMYHPHNREVERVVREYEAMRRTGGDAA